VKSLPLKRETNPSGGAALSAAEAVDVAMAARHAKAARTVRIMDDPL
jgi:hypothetical protein